VEKREKGDEMEEKEENRNGRRSGVSTVQYLLMKESTGTYHAFQELPLNPEQNGVGRYGTVCCCVELSGNVLWGIV
jgi:hypothetical protein